MRPAAKTSGCGCRTEIHSANRSETVADERSFIARLYRADSRARLLTSVGQSQHNNRTKAALLGFLGYGLASLPDNPGGLLGQALPHGIVPMGAKSVSGVVAFDTLLHLSWAEI